MSQLFQVALKFKTPLSLLPPRLFQEAQDNYSVVDRQGLPALGSDGIVLSDAMRNDIEQQYAGGQRDFRGQDWSQQNLAGLNLAGCDLRGVNLFGASLRGTNLAQVDLREANCNRVIFRYGNLTGAVCSDVVFANCLFEYARISRANLVGATFLNTKCLRTLWNANKVAVDRVSPKGIGLTGVLSEQEIDVICQKIESKRRKLVFVTFFVTLCIISQLNGFLFS
jgi:hypothetical protein